MFSWLSDWCPRRDGWELMNSGWGRCCAAVALCEAAATCALEQECLEVSEWPSDNNWAKLLSQTHPSVLPLAKRKIRVGKIQGRGSGSREGTWDDLSYRKMLFSQGRLENPYGCSGESQSPSSCIPKSHPPLVQIVSFALLTRKACWVQSAKFCLPNIATDLELFFFFCFKFLGCYSAAW